MGKTKRPKTPDDLIQRRYVLRRWQIEALRQRADQEQRQPSVVLRMVLDKALKHPKKEAE